MRAAVVFVAGYAALFVVCGAILVAVAARGNSRRTRRSLTIVLWIMVLTWLAGVIVVSARLGRVGISPGTQWAVGAVYAISSLVTVAALGSFARTILSR